MRKKEAATFGTAVTRTLFINSKPFCVLFSLGVTHSFISRRSARQFNLEGKRTETNFLVKLQNDSVIECTNSYKLVPITIGGNPFLVDLIQVDLSNFDIILVMNWLHAYRAKIDCENLKVIWKDIKGREICFHGQ